MNKKILNTLIITFFSLLLLEITIAASLNFPSLWNLAGNKFIPQKIARSERKLIQYMPECAKYDSELTYVFKSGTCQFDGREFNTSINFDKDGHRSIFSSNKRKCSIIFIGDSHTLGWGVEDHENFPFLVSKKLNCSGKNLGVSSYGTVREVQSLAKQDIKKVDFLILQYSDNDLKENKHFFENNNLNIMSENEYNNLVYEHASQRAYYPFKYSYILFSGVTKNLTKRIKRTKANREKILHEEVDYFINALSHVKIDNKPILLILEINGTNRNDKSFISLAQRKISDKIARLFSDIRFLDVSEFLKEEHYFVLDDHMNKDGHKIVSDMISDNLKKKL